MPEAQQPQEKGPAKLWGLADYLNGEKKEFSVESVNAYLKDVFGAFSDGLQNSNSEVYKKFRSLMDKAVRAEYGNRTPNDVVTLSTELKGLITDYHNLGKTRTEERDRYMAILNGLLKKMSMDAPWEKGKTDLIKNMDDLREYLGTVVTPMAEILPSTEEAAVKERPVASKQSTTEKSERKAIPQDESQEDASTERPPVVRAPPSPPPKPPAVVKKLPPAKPPTVVKKLASEKPYAVENKNEVGASYIVYTAKAQCFAQLFAAEATNAGVQDQVGELSVGTDKEGHYVVYVVDHPISPACKEENFGDLLKKYSKTTGGFNWFEIPEERYDEIKKSSGSSLRTTLDELESLEMVAKPSWLSSGYKFKPIPLPVAELLKGSKRENFSARVPADVYEMLKERAERGRHGGISAGYPDDGDNIVTMITEKNIKKGFMGYKLVGLTKSDVENVEETVKKYKLIIKADRVAPKAQSKPAVQAAVVGPPQRYEPPELGPGETNEPPKEPELEPLQTNETNEPPEK